MRVRAILSNLAMALVIVALAAAVILLASDSHQGNSLNGHAGAISGSSLLAVGLSFSILQLIDRPGWGQLLKNLLLAATFLLWGAVQLMPEKGMSKILGDIVIALYVTDLAWTILAKRNPNTTATRAEEDIPQLR